MALCLSAGVKGANGEHSCEGTALAFHVDGRVSAVTGRGLAADTTEELTRASVVVPSSHVAMTSCPSCDPWGSGSHWKPLGEIGMT